MWVHWWFRIAALFSSFSSTLVFLERGASGGNASPVPDVVAIANTYIIFTTLIFVAATIILTLMGVFFGWHFSKNKDQQLEDRLAELKHLIRTDGTIAKSLVESAIENEEADDHMRTLAENMIKSVLQDRAKKSQNNQDALALLISSIGQKEGK